ncbi:MAG: hypothetical protein M0O96_06840 [Desulforhopalus sp.]|nr:hypothetical protein [Desulforhopalus sp.]
MLLKSPSRPSLFSLNIEPPDQFVAVKNRRPAGRRSEDKLQWVADWRKNLPDWPRRRPVNCGVVLRRKGPIEIEAAAG